MTVQFKDIFERFGDATHKVVWCLRGKISSVLLYSINENFLYKNATRLETKIMIAPFMSFLLGEERYMAKRCAKCKRNDLEYKDTVHDVGRSYVKNV